MAESEGISDLRAIFGSSGKQTTSGSSTFKGSQTEQLELDDAAIARIIEQVLGGPQGLAGIFAGEQTAGLFNSTVSAQAAGDVVASLVGELAKLTGKKTVTQESETDSSSKTKTKDGGLLGAIKSIF